MKVSFQKVFALLRSPKVRSGYILRLPRTNYPHHDTKSLFLGTSSSKLEFQTPIGFLFLNMAIIRLSGVIYA